MFIRGTDLYKYTDIHLIIAAMVMKESGVNPKVKGKKRGETGLLQVHGTAQGGYKKKLIRNNPHLGLYLGMKWLSTQIKYCPCFDKPHKDHFDRWLGVITVYMAGVSKGKRGRQCKVFNGARKRIRLARKYRKYLNSL